MSDFHPESWNLMWFISSILTGLLSFMMDKQSYQCGSVNTSAAESYFWQRHLLLSIVRTQHSGNYSRSMWRYIISNNFLSNKFQNSNQLSSQKKKIRGPKMEKLGNLGEDFKKAMMKKSPTYLDYETSDYGVHEFDPQLDFSQFLEEARQHAKEVNFEASSTYTEEIGKKKQLEGEKKKKSWKNSLLSWWKVHKKSKPSMEPAECTNISKPRKGHVSGPIYGSGRGDEMKLRRPTSGPITNLFNPINKGEDEIPYMCLDQINNYSHHVKSYGPVYLVT